MHLFNQDYNWVERDNLMQLKHEISEIKDKVDNLANNVFKLKEDLKKYNEETEDYINAIDLNPKRRFRST